MSPALEEPAERFADQFAVAGLFSCCKATARRFIAQSEGGAIVNVASNAGKAAVINLTRTLAAEWAGHGIDVNAVCPGSVATPMLRNVAEFLSAQSGESADAHFARMVPKQPGRHIQPVEVGRVVAFLLSPGAAIIRGQAVNVDGGETPY